MKRLLLPCLFLIPALLFSEEILTFKALPVPTASVKSGDTLTVTFEAAIIEGWHIWSDSLGDKFLVPTRLEIRDPVNLELLGIDFPQGVQKDLMGLKEFLFEGTVQMTARFRVIGDTASFNAILKYQGCNNQTCIAPAEKSVRVDLDFSAVPVKPSADPLEGRSLLAALLFLLVSGLGLALTPCVYPVIPVTVSFFAGQVGEGRGKAAVLALLYVLGLALTYSAMGTAAALSGSILGSLLQKPLVIGGIALVFVLLSLSMFGLYEIRPPAALMQLGVGRRGYAGALIMGLVVGIVAAPCVGPVTAALLVHVAEKGDPFLGFLYFFVLSLGIGVPFFVLALFSGSIRKLPGSGGWLNWVKKLFGFVLIGMAIYYLGPLLPPYWSARLFALLALTAAVYLGVFEKSAGDRFPRFSRFQRLFGIAVLIVSFFLLKDDLGGQAPAPAAAGHGAIFTYETFQTLRSSGKPFALDFRADWCAPCRAFEAKVLSDAEVARALEVTPLYPVDLTESQSDNVRGLLKEFSITGVPTFLFFDAAGREAHRQVGYMDKGEFLSRIKEIGGQTP